MRPFTPPNAVPRQVRPVTNWNLGDLVNSHDFEGPKTGNLRSCGDLLASSCNTNYGRHTPSFVTGFQCRPHDVHIPCGVECEIQSTIRNLYQVVLDTFPLRELSGVHEIGSTHLNGPFSLSRVGINSNDAGSTDDSGSGDNPEADGTASEDSNVGTLCRRMQGSDEWYRDNGGRMTYEFRVASRRHPRRL